MMMQGKLHPTLNVFMTCPCLLSGTFMVHCLGRYERAAWFACRDWQAFFIILAINVNGDGTTLTVGSCSSRRSLVSNYCAFDWSWGGSFTNFRLDWCWTNIMRGNVLPRRYCRRELIHTFPTQDDASCIHLFIPWKLFSCGIDLIHCLSRFRSNFQNSLPQPEIFPSPMAYYTKKTACRTSILVPSLALLIFNQYCCRKLNAWITHYTRRYPDVSMPTFGRKQARGFFCGSGGVDMLVLLLITLPWTFL